MITVRVAMLAALAKASKPIRDMDPDLRERLVDGAMRLWRCDPDHRTVPTIAITYAALVAQHNPDGDTVEGFEWHARTLEGAALPLAKESTDVR